MFRLIFLVFVLFYFSNKQNVDSQSIVGQLKGLFDYVPFFKPRKSNSELNLQNIETVFEDKNYIELHVKVERFDSPGKIVGYVELKIPVGNDVKLEVQFLKKQGNEYRYLSYRVASGPACKMASKDDYVYPAIARNSDLPANIANSCPLQPGNYTFYGVQFEMDNVLRNLIPSGDYAGELIIRNDRDDVIGIYRAYAQF